MGLLEVAVTGCVVTLLYENETWNPSSHPDWKYNGRKIFSFLNALSEMLLEESRKYLTVNQRYVKVQTRSNVANTQTATFLYLTVVTRTSYTGNCGHLGPSQLSIREAQFSSLESETGNLHSVQWILSFLQRGCHAYT
jgi:hypothetical protein